MAPFHLKTGDEVIVTTGKDAGKRGKITQVFPALNRVAVEGVNVSKRHLRSRKQGQSGQIVEFSMPIHASNVQLIGINGKPMRHAKRSKATTQIV